jgi:hypothetical protein
MRLLGVAGIACISAPLAAAAFALGSSGSAEARAVQFASVQCMTDDGYGRKRPCSALYKKEHPNWRGGEECMTDDGYGRYRPCSAGYKTKHEKSK